MNERQNLAAEDRPGRKFSGPLSRYLTLYEMLLARRQDKDDNEMKDSVPAV